MVEKFTLDIDSSSIQGELKRGSPMVVFSHGFGVERTSANMFTDIAKNLPDHYGYILFDYYDIHANRWSVPGFKPMIQKLREVIAYAQSLSEIVILVGHSQGCTIASLAEIKDIQHVFLAPPTRTITEHFKEFFVSKRKDRARIDSAGDVHLTRKQDGREMIISSDWFDEIIAMPSFEKIQKIAASGKLHIIEALEDDDIKDRRRYITLEKNGAKLTSIHANHNFDPPAREKLVSTIVDILNS